MSRIGNKPIAIPSQVEVKQNGQTVLIKKDKSELSLDVHPKIQVKVEDGKILVSRPDNHKETRSLHGLTRALLNNMIIGVTEGFVKTLQINGIGYKAEKQGNKVVLSLGLSHQVFVEEPEGISIEVPKPNTMIIKGADKQLVGETAAKIRAIRPPEPYKGKGIKYDYEVLRLREGKTGSK